MAKISPVSIKYMVFANFLAEGTVEKPDVIGALFGQTEGLLGSDLEMRDLQKEGKIGRIEVELETNKGKTTGKIEIPSALDKSETTLIAAAIETIEKIGPTESKIEVEKIEDVRGNKRDYIIDRAKKLMASIEGSADSREISKTLKDSARISKLQEYGDEKLPAGDLSDKEIIVVEGRADVINLLKNRIYNVIGMNGTKLPNTIKELSKEKDLILFVDGDRGGKLIAKNVVDNAEIKAIVVAPDGKEVEELSGKEILASLRKKSDVKEFLSSGRRTSRGRGISTSGHQSNKKEEDVESEEDTEINQEKLEKLFNELKKGQAYLLDKNLSIIRKTSIQGVSISLAKSREKITAVVVKGTATAGIIKTAEKNQVSYVVASNFAYVDTKINLLSF